MKATTVFTYGGNNTLDPKAPAWVAMVQTGCNKFTVIYGLQVKSGLDYTQAAFELGKCLMHHLACESIIVMGAN